ncbi:MAG: type VI secretion system baseplate subunit TssE [Gemmataceae bacterium]|nr:type VI secretion system baseplate subunit TssE [Gemmataceae bacterium]
MAKVAADQLLVPSVLDRLLDEDPELTREPAKSRHQVLRELKLSVRRDLEHLLNTRRRCVPPPPALTELDESLVNYGLPDFTGLSMTSAEERDEFRRAVEKVISTCEPRFKTVSVQLVDADEPLDRTLRFRIDALLYAHPAPEAVVFDSAVEPITGNVEIKGVS